MSSCARSLGSKSHELFPDAIQIVDRFRATQHLSDVSKDIFGAASDPAAKPWAADRYKEADDGRIDDLLAALRAHAVASVVARKCADYIDTNRDRMRYPQFRAAGLCTSTGTVEAGCKVAIGTRCKKAGIHWTLSGANAIIALRCSILSGRFEDFWERRAEPTRLAACRAPIFLSCARGTAPSSP